MQVDGTNGRVGSSRAQCDYTDGVNGENNMGHVLELPRSKVGFRLCRVHARPRLFCYIRFRSHSPHALERVDEQDGHESTKTQSQNGRLVL